MAGGKSVLIIEDDADIANLVAINLRDIGLDPEIVSDGESGAAKAAGGEYALVILDLMLPKLDGIEVCKIIRRERSKLPILMLTAKSEEFDKVLGLELGADDYVTKPFGVRELMARIKALLRRAEGSGESKGLSGEGEQHRVGNIAIDTGARRVVVGGSNVELTAKEFDLLALFMENPGRAFSRSQLLDLVWGYSFEGYDHTVNSHINRLRNKIEADPANPIYLRTVWGVGYRFSDPAAEPG
jgi:DNA-binding response OmpR family regulator